MSKRLTTERSDEVDALHRAIEAKGIRIAIFMLGYWGALLFGANKAAELWPQYFTKAPFWAAVVAFLGFAWNSYRDLEDWRLLPRKTCRKKSSTSWIYDQSPGRRGRRGHPVFLKATADPMVRHQTYDAR